MKIEQIRDSWVNRADKDVQASIEMWDSVSADYKEGPLPNWETNEFLRFMSHMIPLNDDMSVLDVGCGAGNYTIALASKVGKAVGLDFSPQMIRFAKEKAQAHDVQNATFISGDWNTFDVEKEKFAKSFDIVFAHLTPAINSALTFEKLIQCAKKHCLMAKPVRRKDSVMDEVRKLAGLKNDISSDDSITYAFALLWQAGYSPYFSYHDEVWESNKSFEEAYSWYIGRVKTMKTLTAAEENTLKEYLASIAVDGKIYEKITSTIVTMVWQVGE